MYFKKDFKNVRGEMQMIREVNYKLRVIVIVFKKGKNLKDNKW